MTFPKHKLIHLTLSTMKNNKQTFKPSIFNKCLIQKISLIVTMWHFGLVTFNSYCPPTAASWALMKTCKRDSCTELGDNDIQIQPTHILHRETGIYWERAKTEDRVGSNKRGKRWLHVFWSSYVFKLLDCETCTKKNMVIFSKWQPNIQI